MAKLKTINVIEVFDGRVLSCCSFKNNKNGNLQAKRRFIRLHKEHNDPDGTTGYERPIKKEFDAMFLDGMYDGIYDDECGYRLVTVAGRITI